MFELIVVLTVIGMSYMIWTSYHHVVVLVKTKRFSRNAVFENFRERVVMTLGLLIFYIFAFLALVFVGYCCVDAALFKEALTFGVKHPTYYLLLGGFLFVGNAVLIYLVRTLIKFFHLYFR